MNRHFLIPKKSWLFLGWVLLALLSASSVAGAGKIENYSADQVFLGEKGQVRHTGKLYVTPNKMRMENPGPEGGREMIVIVRSDLGVYRMLNPEKKVYFERPLNENDMATFSDSVKRGEEVDLGTDKVGGYTCQKKRITTTVEMMGFKQTSQSIIWVSDKFDMPLRTQNSDGSMTELRNIKEGKPAEELFETPKGYRKVANMMEMFEGPSEKGTPEAAQEEGSGMGSDFRKMLPKGFKLPSGSQ